MSARPLKYAQQAHHSAIAQNITWKEHFHNIAVKMQNTIKHNSPVASSLKDVELLLVVDTKGTLALQAEDSSAGIRSILQLPRTYANLQKNGGEK